MIALLNLEQDVNNNLAVNKAHERLVFQIRHESLKQQLNDYYNTLQDIDLTQGFKDALYNTDCNMRVKDYLQTVNKMVVDFLNNQL